ncbi:uncharacterized protein LOC128994331 isoform X2 [Macrosteles quadrilineatus]|uniref:uncharacterized protein LOC128994331 isoform X2 n=1 Tax=Macrosteles quadrilineatus TaxID=74068 RepID=UPI0023E25F6C|nr:uncharacterized protein LOC128994331 isoform X2 [Macrosteles quadrilineatus]
MAEKINSTSPLPPFLPSTKRSTAELGVLNEKLQAQLRGDCKKEIYTQNTIREKEIAIVEYLSALKKLKVDAITPESDVYVTPETSPTNASYKFGHARCVSDSGLSSLAVSDNKYLPSPLYYSLVTVDEVYGPESGDILEKELAEQDQLFKSFKSIISKESKSPKSKPFTLHSPLHRTSQKLPKNCSGIISPKGLELKLNVKANGRDKIKHFTTSRIFKESDGFGERNVKDRFRGDICDGNLIDISVMNKAKAEIDETMEAESIGPDSCLEPASSGYVTASSPKDHTNSENYGGDLTEIATSEDIPHDNDQSARSSSMSSDAGTWDSTFPAAIDKEDDNFARKRAVELDDYSSALVSLGDKAVTPKASLTSVNLLPKSDCALDYNLGSVNNQFNLNEQYYNTNEQENLLGSDESTVMDSSLTDLSALDNKDGKLIGVKTNCFIDAASLLDENEISPAPSNPVSLNGYENPDYNHKSSWSGSEVDEYQSNDVKTINYCETNKLESENNAAKEEKSNYDSDFERRRASIIRRNTFELELDDERLAVLRNECEKHKDKSKKSVSEGNTNCITPGETATFSIGTEATVNIVDITKHTPKSLPSQLNCFDSRKCEDELHSPDSLNNDGPLENVFSNCSKQDYNHYSLPFEINTQIIEPEIVTEVGNGSLTHHVNQVDDTSLSNGFGNVTSPYKNCVEHIQNKIESTPIISGGVSLKDLSSPEKPYFSPLMNRRKTELAPIVSGGSVIDTETEKEVKPRASPPVALSESWIVDMSSDKTSPGMKKKHLSDSVSSLNSENADKVTKMNSSLGFFISLDDKVNKTPSNSSSRCSNYNTSKQSDIDKTTCGAEPVSGNGSFSGNSSSCGFFVDFNSPAVDNKVVEKESAAPDKKLFSMFIDISETGESDGNSKTNSPHVFKKRNHRRTFSGVFPKCDARSRSTEISSESSLEMTEPSDATKERMSLEKELHVSRRSSSQGKSEEKNKKQNTHASIESEPSPVPHRKSLPSGLQPTSQRHSWNFDSHNVNISAAPSEETSIKVHKRSHSVSVNKSLEVMFNVEHDETKPSSVSSVKASTSNSTGYESGPSSIDDTVSRSFNNRSMMASWHGSIKPSAELQKVIAKSEWKDKPHKLKSPLDSKSDIVDICESFDKIDEVASITRSDDFSNASNESSNTGVNNSTFIISDVSNVANATSEDLELTTPTTDVISQLSKDDSDKTGDFDDISEKKSGDIPRTPDHSISQTELPPLENSFSFVKLSDMDKEPNKVPLEGKSIPNRMSRSIPEASWIESKMMTRSATSRSLSRLFPHLNTSTRNLTPESVEQDTGTDFSEISSMQSSMDPSALEGSTEETSASSCGGPVSRLGEDLLRMFLEEISPDVTLEVSGRRIKAHKCILSSRCQYFAAILSGGWVESAGNVISLQGFSYSAVHFALCHIYSGASNIPDSINIVELATLADMLCLEGLKEVIMYTLKVKYCHFFHKPCPMCTVGVLECLPLAAAYGLDEIYRKSLRWITKHFVRVWPTKGFATLPRELLDKCYKQHIVHMTVDNVLETILCCSKLQGLIPNVRWAEPVLALTNKLYDACVKFTAQHFCDILSSDMFMSCGREQLWTMSRLEEVLLSAAEKLPPDQACKCYSHLYKLLNLVDSPQAPVELKLNEGFVEFLHVLQTTVEGSLLKQAARASRTPAWTLMEPQLRHKIQDAACLVIVPGDDRRRARHLNKRAESSSNSKQSADLLKPAAIGETATKKNPQSSRSVPSVKPKTPQPAVKSESTGPRPKTWPYKISEVKSRYLEPKQTPKQSPALAANKTDKPTLTPTARRNVSKSIISSSDSSRTSSPAMRRSLPQRPSRNVTKKDDNLTMSTDSLADPNSASSAGSKKKADPAVKTQAISRIDFIEKNVRSLSLKSSKVGTSANRVASSDSKGRFPQVKIENDKPKYSPVAVSKKGSSQSSPHVKDSPVSLNKGTVNSTPSPSVRRSVLSPKEKSSVTAETKSTMLKRNATYRVQAKSSSPVKGANTKQKEILSVVAASPNTKGNINKLQTKVNSSKKSGMNNNNAGYNKTEAPPRPMVGSRSGTFLKDEPTVLKKPQVANVSE